MRKTYQPQNRKSYVVKRAIKRELIRGLIVGFILGAALLITAVILQGNPTLFLVFAAFGLLISVFSLVAFFKINRCPYCGCFFKGLHWSKPDAGLCTCCGKLIQYTDKKQPKGQMTVQHQQQKAKKRK